MEIRELGRTGLRVSALGFGCGSIGGLMVQGDPGEQRQAIARALDAGVTYFDTAPRYGDGLSEENLGRALRDLGVWDRVIVGTKVRLNAADLTDPGPAVRRSFEASRRRLGRDSVDLLQLHNPVGAERPVGDQVPLSQVREAIAAALREIVAAGGARWTGLTGLGETASLQRAVREGGYATVQSYFNILNPSAGFAGAAGGAQDFAGLIDTAARTGLGVIAIRVLAAGAVSGTPERSADAGDPRTPLASGTQYDEDLERARRLSRLAQAAGLESTLELALRFTLSKPGVSTALVGFSALSQLADALRWTERGSLPEDVVRQVVAAAVPPPRAEEAHRG